MLSACLEYEDILSDKLRGAHPSPFFDKRSDFVDYPSKARLPVAFPKGREPDTHPLTKGGGQGTSTYTFRRICYPPEQKGAMYQGRAIPLPWGGPGWAPTPLFLGGCSAGYCGLKILIFSSGG